MQPLIVQCQQLNGGRFMLVITDANVPGDRSTPGQKTAITMLAILLARRGVMHPDHLTQAFIAIGFTVRNHEHQVVLQILPVADPGEQL